MTYRYILPTASLVLAIVFLAAGIPKIFSPGEFSLAIYRFQLVPYSIVNIMAIYLPWIEVSSGILILLPYTRDAAALIITILLFIFTTSLISALIRGLDITCGCFTLNPDAYQIGIHNIVRNICLFAIAVFILVISRKARQSL